MLLSAHLEFSNSEQGLLTKLPIYAEFLHITVIYCQTCKTTYIPLGELFGVQISLTFLQLK